MTRPIPTFRCRLAALLTTAALCGTPALAFDQTVAVRDGGLVAADISLDAPTRLFFDGDGAAQLIFNSVTGEPPEISATVGDTGDVFLTVVSGTPGQGVTGFLTTQAGYTYKVDLTIAATDAEQVEVISLDAQDALARARADAAALDAEIPPPLKWTRSAGYHRAVVSLIRAVHAGGVPQGMRKARTGEAQAPRVEGLKIRRTHAVIAGDVEALRLSVTNTTEAQIPADALRRHFAPYLGLGRLSGHLPAGATTQIVLLREPVL
ncbi:MAG: type-F conjugative transfer system secretin TraK [Litorimonas sp.]